MKKIILICCALLCVMITEAVPLFLDGKEEIELHNLVSTPSTRSVIHQIEVFKTTSELDVNFLCDVGSINMVIYDGSGNVVYEENVDATAVHQVSIDISDWHSGSYEIRFIDTDGNFMYGEFDVE